MAKPVDWNNWNEIRVMLIQDGWRNVVFFVENLRDQQNKMVDEFAKRVTQLEIKLKKLEKGEPCQ